MGHELALSLLENWVWDQHIVVQALANTNLGGSLVLHGSDREGQGWESLVDLNEKGASALHLQVVDLLQLTLEDGAAGLVLLGFALASRDIDVEADHIAWGELEFGDLLGWGGPVDDNIVSVNDVPLDLVG